MDHVNSRCITRKKFTDKNTRSWHVRVHRAFDRLPLRNTWKIQSESISSITVSHITRPQPPTATHNHPQPPSASIAFIDRRIRRNPEKAETKKPLFFSRHNYFTRTPVTLIELCSQSLNHPQILQTSPPTGLAHFRPLRHITKNQHSIAIKRFHRNVQRVCRMLRVYVCMLNVTYIMCVYTFTCKYLFNVRLRRVVACVLRTRRFIHHRDSYIATRVREHLPFKRVCVSVHAFVYTVRNDTLLSYDWI